MNFVVLEPLHSVIYRIEVFQHIFLVQLSNRRCLLATNKVLQFLGVQDRGFHQSASFLSLRWILFSISLLTRYSHTHVL